jgi:hypothetical protein
MPWNFVFAKNAVVDQLNIHGHIQNKPFLQPRWRTNEVAAPNFSLVTPVKILDATGIKLHLAISSPLVSDSLEIGENFHFAGSMLPGKLASG